MAWAWALSPRTVVDRLALEDRGFVNIAGRDAARPFTAAVGANALFSDASFQLPNSQGSQEQSLRSRKAADRGARSWLQAVVQCAGTILLLQPCGGLGKSPSLFGSRSPLHRAASTCGAGASRLLERVGPDGITGGRRLSTPVVIRFHVIS